MVMAVLLKRYFILKKDEKYKGVTRKCEHENLCINLGVIQREWDCMFNVLIDVNILKKY